MSDGDLASARSLLASQHSEQSCFTCSVRPDDADNASRWQRERQIFNQHAIAKAFCETFDFNDSVTKATAGRNHDFEFARTTIGNFGFGMQLFIRRQTGLAFGLTRLRGHAHPFEFTFKSTAAVFIAFFFASNTFLFLLKPTGVVAFERKAATAIEFKNPLRDVVQEVPVVGNGDNSAGVFLQETLEPINAFGVKVVGRFVKQQ